MSQRVSIIMYHYVRDLKVSHYPEIKGLDLQKFREQIDYIARHYTVITMEDLLAATRGAHDLPPRAALLTFDDAYSDHYKNVFPILDAKGIQGSFFPLAKTLKLNTVLDVNKIHFILAAVPDKSILVNELFAMIDETRREYGLAEKEKYYARFAQANRFDSAEVILIKRLLQRELPAAARGMMTDHLFKKYVTADEASFANELYMSMDQLRCMKKHGMFIGSHGFSHCWLDSLDPEAQRREISLSKEFLEDLGCDTGNWVMCYPYGAYNDSLIDILKTNGCRLGLTTKVGIADLASDAVMALPRLDTTDLPSQRGAAPNDWTLKAHSPGA